MTPQSETNLYEDFILPHFESSQHRDRASEAALRTVRRIPSCGDELELFANIEHEVFTTARFHAVGCIISQAAASILCEHIEGKPIEDVRSLDANSMLALVQVPLSHHRRQCALLPYFALQDLLQRIDDNSEVE